MTAYGFGRKGAGDVAAAPRRGAPRPTQQPRSFQPMRDVADPGEDAESRRAAFLAQERGRDAPQDEPVALPSAETEKKLALLKAEPVLVPTDRSLRTAYALWFFLGLGGG